MRCLFKNKSVYVITIMKFVIIINSKIHPPKFTRGKLVIANLPLVR